jgi:hypothetical protein
MIKLTEVDKAYIAGIIDTEGSIILTQDTKVNSHFKLQITITNTSYKLIRFLSLKLSGLKHSINRRYISPKRKTAYSITLQAQSAEILLKEIFPYLVLKKEQAEIALKYRETIVGRGKFNRYYHMPKEIISKRKEYANLLRSLNRKVVV